MTFKDTEWDSPLRFKPDGTRIREHVMESPYKPMAEIIEGEGGEILRECFACGQFREKVHEVWEEVISGSHVGEMVPLEVCEACYSRAH